ncbi:MAG: hypothetical protein CL916_12460 [Deltaproteobacteria bacterium]|nr:hypothetical protein [Deltaproteobacteria bacterium]
MYPFLFLVSCEEPVEIRTLSYSFIKANTVVEVQSVPVGYTDELRATFRSVNEYGASIASSDVISYYVGDSNAEGQVFTDAFGYARPVIGEGGSVSLSTTEDKFFPYIQSENQALKLPQITPLESQPDIVERGTDGFLLTFGSQLHWQSALMGSQSYSVLNADGDILGLWSRHLDGDGVLDAVVWTEQSVFLMRGVPDGGMSWGGGLSFEDRVVAVSASDLNGDRIFDLAIGVTSDTDSIVALFHSDGNWGYIKGEEMLQPYPLEAMVAEDENRDGRADVSLIDESTGYVRRYTYDSAGWAGGLPSIIEPSQFIAPKGSHMPPMIDLNADGRNDLLVVGPEGANTQDLVFFIIQESFVIFRQQYASFLAEYADIDHNGSTDILTFTTEGLRYLWYGTDTGEFTANTFTGFGDKRPFSILDADNDGITDVVFFGEQLLLQPGSWSDEGAWRISPTIWTSYDNRFTEDFVVGDFDEDGVVEVVGFIMTGVEVKIETSELTLGAEENFLTSVDVYPFAGDLSDGLDFAQCGNDLIALTRRAEGGGDFVYEVRRFNVVNNELNRRASRGLSGELRMDCTVVDNQTYMVVGTGADWRLLRDDMSEIDTGPSANWVDIAVGDIDNAGSLDVRGCDTADCRIDMADLDGDGLDEVIINSGDITVEGWDTTVTLSQQGPHRIVDVDGDGFFELLVHNAQGLWVFRGSAGGLLPPFGLQINTDTSIPAHFVDIDGDGVRSPVVLRDNGKLAHPKQ